MNTTKEQRKEKAIELMKKLDIYKPYIKEFKKSGNICIFENFAGYCTWNDKKLFLKIKEIESKYNCTIFTVIHKYTELGEIFDFLLVNDYKNNWNHILTTKDNFNYIFVYEWNKTNTNLSGFCTITIVNSNGGIRRVE